MRKLLPKLRLLSAYASLSLLFAGWAAFVLVYVHVHAPIETDSKSTASNGGLEAQRQAAIEDARKQGKHEYTFNAGKIPVPVAP